MRIGETTNRSGFGCAVIASTGALRRFCDDEVIIEYLKAALEENDPAFFVKAVGNAAGPKSLMAFQNYQLRRVGPAAPMAEQRTASAIIQRYVASYNQKYDLSYLCSPRGLGAVVPVRRCKTCSGFVH